MEVREEMELEKEWGVGVRKISKGFVLKRVEGEYREDEWVFLVIVVLLRYLRNIVRVVCVFLK